MRDDELNYYLHFILFDSKSPWCCKKHSFLLFCGYKSPIKRKLLIREVFNHQPLTSKDKDQIARLIPDVMAGKVKPRWYEKRIAEEDVEILWPNPPVPLQCLPWQDQYGRPIGFEYLRKHLSAQYGSQSRMEMRGS